MADDGASELDAKNVLLTELLVKSPALAKTRDVELGDVLGK